MANKRLSQSEIQIMKDMVLRGTAPEDIAKHFKIAISSVHNYKARFKSEGVKFPSVRGKRPVGNAGFLPQKLENSSQVNSFNETNTQGIQFVLDGISIQVSGDAKAVNIGKNKLEISF